MCVSGSEKALALARLVMLVFVFLSSPQCLSPQGRVFPLKAVIAANFGRLACHLFCSWGSRLGEEGTAGCGPSPVPAQASVGHPQWDAAEHVAGRARGARSSSLELILPRKQAINK